MYTTAAGIIRKAILHARFEQAALYKDNKVYTLALRAAQNTFANLGTQQQKELFIKAYSRTLQKMV